MDAKGELYGFCEQKRFKIKDELNVYDDEFKTHEWLRIKQKNYVQNHLRLRILFCINLKNKNNLMILRTS